MKILYLTGERPDFATDLLFNGIVELLGHDNIVDYPYAEYRHVKKIAGTHYLYLCSTIDKDVDNRKRYNIEEIRQLIDNEYFDLCIASTRAHNIFTQLVDNTTRFPRIIIINGEDDSDSTYDLIKVSLSKYWKSISLFLQRDYKYNYNYDDRVVPYIFSCPVNILPNLNYKKDKEIDVFGYFAPAHPFRKKVIERIQQIKGAKIDMGYTRLHILDYFMRMNNSKISISVTGAGWDTSHYLEFMKSMLLAQHPKNAIHRRTLRHTPIIYPNNFKDKYSAVFYKTDLSDLEKLIRYYLKNDNEREEITRRGYDHVTNNLTTKKMAEYVFKCLDDTNYWRSLPL